jgi:hypothetical protein
MNTLNNAFKAHIVGQVNDAFKKHDKKNWDQCAAVEKKLMQMFGFTVQKVLVPYEQKLTTNQMYILALMSQHGGLHYSHSSRLQKLEDHVAYLTKFIEGLAGATGNAVLKPDVSPVQQTLESFIDELRKNIEESKDNHAKLYVEQLKQDVEKAKAEAEAKAAKTKEGKAMDQNVEKSAETVEQPVAPAVETKPEAAPAAETPAEVPAGATADAPVPASEQPVEGGSHVEKETAPEPVAAEQPAAAAPVPEVQDGN